MKRLALLLLPALLCADLVPVPIMEITDSPATNFYFSVVFYVFLIATPTKLAIQMMWDYARRNQ